MAQIDKKIQLPDPIKDQPQNITAFAEHNIKYEGDLNDALLRYTTKIADIINGGIRIEDNLNCQIVSATITLANTEQAIAHNLKRVPAGYIVLGIDKAAVIYNGTTSNTSTSIYVRSNTAATAVKLLIL